MISRRTSTIPKEMAAGEMHKHCQALCKQLPHNHSHCKECNTCVVLLVRICHQKVQDVSVKRDMWPRRRVAWNSASDGTMLRQSCQSRPEHPGVSDGN